MRNAECGACLGESLRLQASEPRVVKFLAQSAQSQMLPISCLITSLLLHLHSNEHLIG